MKLKHVPVFLSLILIIAIIAGCTSTNNKTLISGHVADTDRPLQQVEVKIYNVNGDQYIENGHTITDMQGNFTIEVSDITDPYLIRVYDGPSLVYARQTNQTILTIDTAVVP